MLVTLCSTDIKWENKFSNIKYLDSLFSQFDFSPDLVILPEMFNTGFTMNISMAEDISDSQTLKWMQRTAAKYNFAIMGSFPVLLDENNLSGRGKVMVNRAFFVFPDSSYQYYDKRHLFRMGEENNHYSGGKEKSIVHYKGISFALNICYDLRFPVWSRNIDNEYDVLINIANFPASRVKVIEPLCRARAIENMAYMLFVNRVGEDPQCSYVPSSYAIDYKGDIVGKEISGEFKLESIDCVGYSSDLQVINIEIDVEALHLFRDRFPAWMDEDKFEIKNI